MNMNQWVFMLATTMVTSSALAASNSIPLIPPPSGYNWVSTVSAGTSWNTSSRSQTFYLTPETLKSYPETNSSQAFLDGEFFLGVQKTLWPQIQGQLGLAFAVTGNAKLIGDILDDADPAFNNYNYQYKVSHTHIALQGKVLIDKGYSVIPWFSALAGLGFNRANAFTNSPTIFQAVPTSNFRSDSETSFTYALSVGLQKPVDNHWQVGVGYEFSDWGKSQLGTAEGQTMGNGLSIDHMYVNSLLVNVTYLSIGTPA